MEYRNLTLWLAHMIGVEEKKTNSDEVSHIESHSDKLLIISILCCLIFAGFATANAFIDNPGLSITTSFLAFFLVSSQIVIASLLRQDNNQVKSKLSEKLNLKYEYYDDKCNEFIEEMREKDRDFTEILNERTILVRQHAQLEQAFNQPLTLLEQTGKLIFSSLFADENSSVRSLSRSSSSLSASSERK